MMEFSRSRSMCGASRARIVPRRTAHARRMTCIFCTIPSRQHVVADAPEQQLQPLGMQRLGTDHGSEPALERREHRLHYAALVVRLFKLFGVLLLPPDHLCPRAEPARDVVLAGADDGPRARVADHLQ